MAKPIIASIFFLLAVCSYCGVNFESLGRHVWRCKQKLNDRNESDNNENNDQQASQPPEHNISEVNNPVNSNSTVKCCCGKACKGLRALKCINALAVFSVELKGNSFIISSAKQMKVMLRMEILQTFCLHYLTQRRMCRLPKTDKQWSIANSFFQAAIPVSDITQENTDASICSMNEKIYEYFKGKILNCHNYVEFLYTLH